MIRSHDTRTGDRKGSHVSLCVTAVARHQHAKGDMTGHSSGCSVPGPIGECRAAGDGGDGA
jgi:hypothetical protein